MDFGSKLEELELTTDEIGRLSKALKDETFRAMLNEYAEEISNPESKKQYEEEITKLEQERGVDVHFVHPKPHHVLKTSLHGKEKCFINVCSNDFINKPTAEAGRAEDGRVGQHWSLPYSLTPGRPDRDHKGNKCTTYDVVFHPDTLYIAEKNQRFMELVNSTAIQGIEDAFKVKLDKMNLKILKMPYKGVPHPAVIRKPIPGHPGEGKALVREELFQNSYTHPAANTEPQTSAPQNFVKESSPASQPPTKPHYTIKYRSVVDLQDYRCSRDSAPSLRPKEMVITIDLPLITSAGDVDLNVTERRLTLESQKPAYKLELHLSYPVDEDKGDAKFIKAKKQLTVTLPVLQTKGPAEEKQHGSDEDRESVNKVEEVRKPAFGDQDEQSDMNFSDSSCGIACLKDLPVEDEERGLQFSSDRTDSCKSDWVESYYEASLSYKAAEETDLYNLREEEKHHLNGGPTTLPSVVPVVVPDNGSHTKQCHQTLANTDISPNECTVAQVQSSHFAPHSVKMFHEPNDTIHSRQTTGRSVVENSVLSVSSSQMNSTVEDTINTLCCSGETGLLPEEQVLDGCHGQATPTVQHKTNQTAPLIEETKIPLMEQVDNVQAEPSKTDFTIKTPAILREKSPEDGSEVIITEHSTSAALSFQNSLWFELD